MNPRPVTLQINLAPSDHRHAAHLLLHQVRVWRPQVDQILLVIDFHRSAGRFSESWEAGRASIAELAASIPGAQIAPVDYGPEARKRVAEEFFGGCPVPAKDFRGGPYYAYFFGLNAAAHDSVLHLDSDLFFGGRNDRWIAEAQALLDAKSEVLFTAPHPGPPAADGRLHSQSAEPAPDVRGGFRFDGMSTRLFFFRRSRFRERIGALRPQPPPLWRNRIKAWVEKNPAQDLPEHLFTLEMRRRGLSRVEFLGSPPGLWSLHPPYRTADFFRRLPELVARVESGDVPEGQRGDHDLNDSMVDWTEAKEALRTHRWWRRWRRSLR